MKPLEPQPQRQVHLTPVNQRKGHFMEIAISGHRHMTFFNPIRLKGMSLSLCHGEKLSVFFLREMGEDACYPICCPRVFLSPASKTLPGLPYLPYDFWGDSAVVWCSTKTEWASISSWTIELSSWIFLRHQIPDHLLFDSHFILASATLNQDFFCFPFWKQKQTN